MFFLLACIGLLGVGLTVDFGVPEDEDDDTDESESSASSQHTTCLFPDSVSPHDDTTSNHDPQSYSNPLDFVNLGDAEQLPVETVESGYIFDEHDSVKCGIDGDENSNMDHFEYSSEYASGSSESESESDAVSGPNDDAEEQGGIDENASLFMESDSTIDDAHPVQFNVLKGDESSNHLSGVGAQIEMGSGVVVLYGTSADDIYGGDGDDTLIVGGNDVATGGEGSDVFIIDGDTDDAEVPVVSDFQIDQDVIEISIPSPEDDLATVYPERPSFNGEISVTQKNGDTFIQIDGKSVCRLVGLHELEEASIEVVYDHHGQLKTDFDLQYGY